MPSKEKSKNLVLRSYTCPHVGKHYEARRSRRQVQKLGDQPTDGASSMRSQHQHGIEEIRKKYET